MFQEKLLELKYFVGYSLSPQYKQDRNSIKNYFDEKFYLKHYGKAVKKSGLAPIDHFLKKGWFSNDWHNHTDPNSWFNTTLYQERLWNKPPKNENRIDYLIDIFRIKTNPLVDFLNQPRLKNHNNNIEVWLKKDEVARAWLAVEGLMRLDRFNVTLHAPNNINPKDIICFAPQVKRGLKILLDNKQNKSFFHSDFIRNPSKYKLTDLKSQKVSHYADTDSITYVRQDFDFLMHRLYNYTDWMETGRINPTMINFLHYCDEPLIGAPFFENFTQTLAIILKGVARGNLKALREFRNQNFKDYLVRIADGFDLCIVDAKLPIRNLKIVPGFMGTYIDEQELSKKKEFSISFLLTMKRGRSDKWDYKLRDKIWEKEKDFKIPTKFYLSYRDKDRFPKNLQNRVMPTSSKKWVFNSEFNIAIENTRQEYYFTEKILGCFISLTVPIYMGCPNISNYFDPRGMIIVQSVDELIQAANSLNPRTYQTMLPYLKKNKKRALKLLNLEKEIIAAFGKKLH